MTATANPSTDNLTSLSEAELLDRIAASPYVPLYRVLLARKRREGDETAYRKSLREAALYTPDRVRLYEVLHQPEPEPEPVEEAGMPAEALTEPAILPEAVHPEVRPEPVPASTPEVETEERAEEAPPGRPSGEAPKRKRRKPEKDKGKEADKPKGAKESPAEGLKERLIQTAAARQVSLDEKHTFLEWLDILENPEAAAPVSSGAGAGEDPLAGHAASARYEAELQREMDAHEAAGTGEQTGGEGEDVQSLAERSVAPSAGLATETLAKIMLKQGKIKQALAVYEELRLKYPEKSDYFAALIEDLKAN